MGGPTTSSMRDARDAEDRRLLDEGALDLLLAGWCETIIARCVARMRGPVGHDVAPSVSERLSCGLEGALTAAAAGRFG